MNRRTVLGLAGASATVSLAGCLDGIQEHFGLQGVIPVEIYSEADRTFNLRLQAYDIDADRESYEHSFSITPGESVKPPNLDQTNQSFRVANVEDEEEAIVREVSVTENTRLVVIRLYDDDIVIEVDRGEDAGNETVDGDDAENGATDTEESSDDTDENESNDDTDGDADEPASDE